jgi:predicted N-acetyltransferase YhbS
MAERVDAAVGFRDLGGTAGRQGQGVGRRLVEHAIRVFRAEGAATVIACD